MSSIKLYWNAPFCLQFTARVMSAVTENSATVLTLDQTVFYPEGGGQPADKGTIDSLKVVDVQISDDGVIRHYLERTAGFVPEQEVSCQVDAAYRLEMTQQHTGQHILSQAFIQLYGAETRGFRISEAGAEIDLALELHQEEIAAAIFQAETLANNIVFENREIRSHLLTPEAAAKLPLRKESFVTDCVRVIEIADFDWSPCGGTHAQRTGEVGLIAIKGHERAKQMTRVQFVCGVRALRDYRQANQTAREIAGKFSTARDDAPASVQRLIEESKIHTRRIREMAEKLAVVEAAELLERAELISPAEGNIRLVRMIFEDRGLEEIKLLAHRLVAHEKVIVLLAAQAQDHTRLVLARSPELRTDMNQLMRKAAEMRGWRGGGKPDFVQGGGQGTAGIDELLGELQALLNERTKT